jgi:hypothetical protein
MNRRSLVTALLAAPALALGAWPAIADRPAKPWRMIGRLKIKALDKDLSFALNESHMDLNQFELRATKQALWVDSVTVFGPRDQAWTRPVALNLPPGGKLAIDKHFLHARKLSIAVNYLPYDFEPTYVEVWGTAEPAAPAPGAT